MQTDARSDVYALGRLLGYALTGEKPDTEAYETALSDRSIVPEALYDVVQKATAFEPSARYQTAGELARAVQEALTGVPLPEPVAAPAPEAAPQPAHPQSPIRRASRSFMEAPLYLRALAALAWIALVVGFLIVLAASVTYWLTNAPIWHAEQYTMAVVVDAGIAYLCFEIYKAVCLRGAYATERHPVRLFVTRICIYCLIIFLLMMALGIFVSYLREG
jgi:hypothetical protein